MCRNSIRVAHVDVGTEDYRVFSIVFAIASRHAFAYALLEPRPCHAHSSRKVPKRIGSSFHQGIRAYERCRRWQELSPIWRVRSRVVINTTTLSYENRPAKNANTPHQTAKNLPGGLILSTLLASICTVFVFAPDSRRSKRTRPSAKKFPSY